MIESVCDARYRVYFSFVSVHHSIRLNENTDVMQQDADFITADYRCFGRHASAVIKSASCIKSVFSFNLIEYMFLICVHFHVPGCAHPLSTSRHVTCAWGTRARLFGIRALIRAFECVRKCMAFVCDCNL